MKLSLMSNPKIWHHGHLISRASKALFFSAKTRTSSSTSTSSKQVDTLFSRISKAGNPRFSIVPVLEQWLEEGKEISFSQLQSCIRQLRKYRRFTHALQISQWMTDQKGYNLSPGDIAIRLDLISKVHGLKQAEKYFNSIPDSSKDLRLYGALLNCYASNKCLDKAEATFQQMKELGFVQNSLAYNVMLSLYSQVGKHEKLDVLIQEMEKSDISCDSFTYNIRLNAYAATANTEKMEKLLTEMKADPKIKMTWHTCVVVVNGYLKAGLIDNALAMLKRSEQLIDNNSRRPAYEIFLTLYAAAGNKDELYRMWRLYKSQERLFNSGYVCMISSLIKLDDIDGAERISNEWLSGMALFDCRIPIMIINAYSKKGRWEKAEALVNKIIETGTELNASMWDHLATAYHVCGQMEKAVETIKKAISSSKQGWKPNIYTMAACLKYLKGQGDVDEAENFLKILGEHCHLSTTASDRLKNCINEANMSTTAIDQMEGNNKPLNGENCSNEAQRLGLYKIMML